MGPTNRSTEPLDRLGAVRLSSGRSPEPCRRARDGAGPRPICASFPVCTCLLPRNLSACNAQAGGRQVRPAYRPLSACGHAQAGGGADRRTGSQAERTGDFPTPDPPCLPAGGCSYRRGRWTGPPPRPRSRAARGPVPFGHRLPRAPHVGSASRLRPQAPSPTSQTAIQSL